jgi:hypothetical protein
VLFGFSVSIWLGATLDGKYLNLILNIAFHDLSLTPETGGAGLEGGGLHLNGSGSLRQDVLLHRAPLIQFWS